MIEEATPAVVADYIVPILDVVTQRFVPLEELTELAKVEKEERKESGVISIEVPENVRDSILIAQKFLLEKLRGKTKDSTYQDFLVLVASLVEKAMQPAYGNQLLVGNFVDGLIDQRDHFLAEMTKALCASDVDTLEEEESKPMDLPMNISFKLAPIAERGMARGSNKNNCPHGDGHCSSGSKRHVASASELRLRRQALLPRNWQVFFLGQEENIFRLRLGSSPLLQLGRLATASVAASLLLQLGHTPQQRSQLAHLQQLWQTPQLRSQFSHLLQIWHTPQQRSQLSHLLQLWQSPQVRSQLSQPLHLWHTPQLPSQLSHLLQLWHSPQLRSELSLLFAHAARVPAGDRPFR